MRVCRSFPFDAAHFLPDYPGKCSKLHGHRWTLEVEIEGPVNPRTGFVMDFSELKILVQSRVIDHLDHDSLNIQFPNPTAEKIVQWVWVQLEGIISRLDLTLTRLRLYETPDSYVEMTKNG